MQIRYANLFGTATASLKAEKAVWTSYDEATIKVPAQEVYAAVRDFESYSKWNECTPSI